MNSIYTKLNMFSLQHFIIIVKVKVKEKILDEWKLSISIALIFYFLTRVLKVLIFQTGSLSNDDDDGSVNIG